KKCHFCESEIKVLGHVVSAAGISPDPDKLAAVQKFPTPTSAKELQSFLGLCSYFRRFVRNFSSRVSSLRQLLSQDTPFIWTEQHEAEFGDMKSALSSPPVLAHFSPDQVSVLHTDASSFGLGAVLLQRESSSERPVAFASRSLSVAEKNYSTTERECLAIVWAVQKFRPYLYGRHFIVVTDHHSLCWLKSLRNPTSRLARWSLKLQEFAFDIVYKSGERHQDADALSRNPIQNSTTVAAIVQPRTPQDIRSLQLNDLFTGPIIRDLESSSSSAASTNQSRKHYELQNGILYRRTIPYPSLARFVVP